MNIETIEQAPSIVVVSGMQGAGKSSVARLLAERFERAAYIGGASMQQMIVSGGVWPESRRMSEMAASQLRLRLHHLCLLGRSFVQAGYWAVLDDIVIGRRLDELLVELSDVSFHFVMLMPDLPTAIERERQRGTHLYEAWAWMDDEVRHGTRRLGLWLDTSSWTVEQTLDEILARRADALVPISSGPS